MSTKALVTITPTHGGPDAEAWASMLYRMYLRWAERNGYRTDDLDTDNPELLIDVDPDVLRYEVGVHRLVRLSPFDEQKRRQTSFVRVAVNDLDPIQGEHGDQIRNYVLDPYQLVKDFRTAIEREDPSEVLDGVIEPFWAGSVGLYGKTP